MSLNVTIPRPFQSVTEADTEPHTIIKLFEQDCQLKRSTEKC